MVLALCQGITGYWAFHVSVPAKYGRWRWLFGGVTVVGIVLVILTGIRSNQTTTLVLSGIGEIKEELRQQRIPAPSPKERLNKG
ncbi:MAG: hypothetical protein WB678_02220 [Stellaceae bacterium]